MSSIPTVTSHGLGAVASPEVIRKAHLGREANIRSMAFLMFLSGGVNIIAGVVLLGMNAILLLGVQSGKTTWEEFVSLAVLPTLIGVILLPLGIWFWRGAGDLRRLSPSGRAPGIGWSILSLGGFPVGTIIGISMLVMLLDTKGKYVLSDEYRDVINATPDIEYKTSIVVKVLLALVIALVALAMLAAIFGPVAEG